jgi:hypothetical protein
MLKKVVLVGLICLVLIGGIWLVLREDKPVSPPPDEVTGEDPTPEQKRPSEKIVEITADELIEKIHTVRKAEATGKILYQEYSQLKNWLLSLENKTVRVKGKIDTIGISESYIIIWFVKFIDITPPRATPFGIKAFVEAPAGEHIITKVIKDLKLEEGDLITIEGKLEKIDFSFVYEIGSITIEEIYK